MSRRLRRAYIDPLYVGGLLTGEIRIMNLPLGTRAVRFVYDINIDKIGLMLEHESFAEIPHGDEIPEFILNAVSGSSHAEGQS